MKLSLVLPILLLAPLGAAVAQAPILPITPGGAVLKRADLLASVAPRDGGAALGLAPIIATRAGDDRIMIDVLRRAGATAEGPVIHSVVTEVYTIIEGSGQIELGGAISDPKPMRGGPNGGPTNPANIGPSVNGTVLTGGTLHAFAPGDQIMIPPGVSHRFFKLDSPVVYSVVRINPGYEKGK